MVSTHEKPIAGDSQPTQNIQINKVTGENEKCVLFYGKKLNELLGQPSTFFKLLLVYNSVQQLFYT